MDPGLNCFFTQYANSQPIHSKNPYANECHQHHAIVYIGDRDIDEGLIWTKGDHVRVWLAVEVITGTCNINPRVQWTRDRRNIELDATRRR